VVAQHCPVHLSEILSLVSFAVIAINKVLIRGTLVIEMAFLAKNI